MHPAASIIFFTTASGLGYGLAAVLGRGVLDPAAIATRIAHVLALALIAAGLLSSTLHLRNPQRAWRAFSQWRSSWLSREGVLAVATFVPLTINAFAAVFLSRQIAVAGQVLDHDLCAQLLAQRVGDQAAQRVGRAARCEADQQVDGFVGLPGVGSGRAGCQDGGSAQ